MQAIKPVINAARKPIDNDAMSMLSKLNLSLNTSFAILPKIKGTTIKKENQAC